MILYYVTTYYQLLCSIVHKIKYHNEKKCIFAVDSFLKDFESSEKLKNIINGKVVTLNFIPIKQDFDSKTFIKIAKKEVNKLILSEFKKIYISSAHSWFGIFLSINNIHFSMFEECYGIINKLDKLKDNVRKFSEKQDEICEKYGLYNGDGEQIDSLICSHCDSNFKIHGEINYFNLVDELNRFDKTIKEKIVEIFTNLKNVYVNKNSSLLLTQHFANLNILSWEEQKEIYQVIADYFIPEGSELIVKNHPADIMGYENILQGSKVIRNKFPAEILPFIFTQIPSRIITVSSTGIDTISNLFSEKVSFDFDYEQSYPLTHEYYSILKISEKYLNAEYKFYSFGTQDVLLDNLLTYSDLRNRKIYKLENFEQIQSLQDKSVIYIDDLGPEYEYKYENIEKILLKLKKNVIIIFFNNKKRYLCFDGNYQNIINNIMPVDIYLKQTSIKKVGGAYIFSKGEVSMENIYKKLNYEKAELFTEMFTDDKQKIKVLEGVLRSTEQRLNFYINKNNELKKLLEDKK